MKNLRPIALFVTLLCCGCQGSREGMRLQPGEGKAQLFEGLGSHRRPVRTSNELAQRYFDQGLILAYAFNHDEAIRSFKEAARLDPDCAMAYWGVALCCGPHINKPDVPADRARVAWDAIQKAIACMDRESPVHQALIHAQAMRYADPPPSDRAGLDQAYAAAMRQVHQQCPDDPDVAVLFAESMMDLRPWDLWTTDGAPQPGTDEIVTALEQVMKSQPDHPGANHLYIHAVEASPRPDRALAAADRLRDLVPASGHLVHMPSHIDVLTGRWSQAIEQNEKAITADRRYRAASPRQQFYRVYMAHNTHMLCFAAMMEGRGALAIESARSIVDSVPESYARDNAALVDPFLFVEYEALMRFGRWEDILHEPAPPKYLPVTTASWRFARGVAYAARKQISQAQEEQRKFRDAVAKVPEDATLMINKAHQVLAIADHVLDGEIAYHEGRTSDAIASLTRAVELEDQLRYMEPPEWIQPARHALGAILLADGRYDEAEKVYRQDLAKWPENGWSLYGLAQALRGREANNEAAQIEVRFRKAWANADQRITASCLCVTPAK